MNNDLCRLPKGPLGYFDWLSIAKTDDGTLVAASSGLRKYHVCPWGKTVLHFSKDNGKTWSDSVIANNSPIDDRDAWGDSIRVPVTAPHGPIKLSNGHLFFVEITWKVVVSKVQKSVLLFSRSLQKK